MSIDACAELVKSGDPDRYLSVMAAPVGARDRLFVLYAFNLEVARAPWASKEEMIAEMRLQWWLDTINEIYKGNVRHHEVVAPLAEMIAKYNLPQALFIEIIEARRFDIYRESHSGMSAFDAYINATSGNLMRLAVMSLGAKDLDCVANFGYGVGIANLWRALPALYAAGRHPVPVTCALDRNAVAGGRVPENLSDALREISTSALSKVQAARKLRAQIPKPAVPAMLSGWQVSVPLTMVKVQPQNTLVQPLETSEFQKRLALLWRSSTSLW
ncbi:MAG: phytoene synthase [Rhodobacteraceae bacterium]|nr:MAG: phytoene synthase [Paracoccaceae bacterium]